MDLLRSKISRMYYNHGLFCATHPTQVIVFVCLIVLFLCYPLSQIPIVNDVPLDHFTLKEDEFRAFENAHLFVSYGNPNKSLGYMQQIVLHSIITPSSGFACFSTRKPVLRALEKSFELVQLIREFRMNSTEPNSTGSSFEDLCFQVEDRAIFEDGAGDNIYNTLPTFGCLLLAPSLLWDNLEQFWSQQATLFTRLKQASVGNLRDLFFGFMWKMTGITRYPVCARETTVSFAITLVLRDYHPQFISQLRDYLLSHFERSQFPVNSIAAESTTKSVRHLPPSSRGDLSTTSSAALDPLLESDLAERSWTRTDSLTGARHVYLVWYRVRSYLSDYAPLILIYLVLLLYIYFSVRKLEMVKSKLGLAFSACFTVVASLFMSIGLCINIGLMVPTLNGSEIFPYLVVLIGFENVVILTKSVVATPIDLPVKYRIAQGLSKESWPLTKHYVTQFVLLALGFFTFHPTMQEFCLFAVVGVTTDFFLQLFFFVSVLSIDIRRMELSDLSKQYPNSSLVRDPQLMFAPNSIAALSPEQPNPFTVVRSGPPVISSSILWHVIATPMTNLKLKLTAAYNQLRSLTIWSPAGVSPPFRRGHKRKVSAAEAAAFLASDERPAEYFPRRLRILRMWAKHRLIQRFILVFISLWLLIFLIYAVDISQLLPTALKSLVLPRNTETPLNAIKPELIQGKTNEAADEAAKTETHSTTPVITMQTPSAFISTYSEKSTPSESEPLESLGQKSDMLHVFNEIPFAHVLRHPTEATWNRLLLWNYLAFYHWPLLAKHYNLSLAGYHSVLLEPVHLKHHIEVESIPSAASSSSDSIYEPDESSKPVKHSYWKWHPSSGFRFPDFWTPDKYWDQSAATIETKPKSDSNPVTTFTEELMLLFRQSRRGSAADISPGGLAGWAARLSLTASILGTTVLCCSLVLMATCLGMIFFQELQAKSRIKREPVVRVLPLTITLSTSKGSPLDADIETDLLLLPEWTIACGKLPHQIAGGISKDEGVVAAHCCLQFSEHDPNASSHPDTIRLFSTDSGLPLENIQRFSNSSMAARLLAASSLRRTSRRPSTVWSMAFNHDGRLLVGCSDGMVEIWNCETRGLENLLVAAHSFHAIPRVRTDMVDNRPHLTDATVLRPFAHCGGITILKVTGASSFLTGTSRGYVALFSFPHLESYSFTPSVPILPTRLWQPHTKPVTHLSSAYLRSIPSAYQIDTPESDMLILSASEDSHVAIVITTSDEPLYRLSLDSTSIIGFDFYPMVIAVSHASGSLYVVRFGLIETSDALPTPAGARLTVPSFQVPLRVDVLEQTLLATGSLSRGKCSLNVTAKHVQSHSGSVGLKLLVDNELQSSSTDGTYTSCLLSEFRLATCELDGTFAIWELRPPRLVRSFRLNLSTLSPSNPIAVVNGRIVFGDQGYLRVVNPWTAKYERSVQLLPPSTALFRNTNSVSSSLLSAVLRKWSKELVPVGVAGSCHDPIEPIYTIPVQGCESVFRDRLLLGSTGSSPTTTSRLTLASNSVMVSLADSGRTLVIVPLNTLQPC